MLIILKYFSKWVGGKICGRRRKYFFKLKKRSPRYTQIWITEVKKIRPQASIDMHEY
jgi:hypothetical protein